MTPELEQAFEAMFRMTVEEGRKRLRYLVKNSITMGRFTAPMSLDSSKISVTEKDFAIVAFFGCVGAGTLDAIAPTRSATIGGDVPFSLPSGDPPVEDVIDVRAENVTRLGASDE